MEAERFPPSPPRRRRGIDWRRWCEHGRLLPVQGHDRRRCQNHARRHGVVVGVVIVGHKSGCLGPGNPGFQECNDPEQGPNACLLSELYLSRAPWMPDDGWGAKATDPRAPLLPTADLMSHRVRENGQPPCGDAKNLRPSVLFQLVPRSNLFHRSKQTNKHHVSIHFPSEGCVCL